MAWIAPIYNRTQQDVDTLKDVGNRIRFAGWENATNEDKVAWVLGDTFRLVASDGPLLTSDGENFVVGSGIIKGAINDIDLNRIQGNIVFLQEKLELEHGVTVVIDDSNPYWIKSLIPLLSNINRIRDNVVALVNSYPKFPSTPTIEYNNPVNWDDANDIERNLYDLLSILTNAELSWKFCGTYNCGNADGIL